MVEQARLERVASGLTPVTPGWFVVNARGAAWMNNDQTESCCIFESDHLVLRGRPDLTEYEKPGAGFVLRVLRPGRRTGYYHAESVQEDFLVLMGECVLIIEDEERHLRAWDFVNCPPGTGHAFVGAGDGPCVLLCAGNREPDDLSPRTGAGTVDSLDSARRAGGRAGMIARSVAAACSRATRRDSVAPPQWARRGSTPVPRARATNA